MTQTGLFATRSPSGLFGSPSKNGEKGVQKGKKTDQTAKPNPKYKNTGVASVTCVTEAVTSVTPRTPL